MSLSIDNGSDTRVTIDAANASADPHVYTCVPGLIRQTREGVAVEPLELYSKSHSENRPKLRAGWRGNVKVQMDKGPENDCK